MKLYKSTANSANLPKAWLQILLASVLTAILLTACATPGTQPTPVPQAVPTSVNPSGNSDAAVTAAKNSLAQQLNISVASISLVDVQPVQWPDSCLGVQTPGIMCAMHVVDGYRITLSANDQTYEVHSNLDGSQIVIVPKPVSMREGSTNE